MAKKREAGKVQGRNRAKGVICAYCTKKTYSTKQLAKRAGRVLYPGEPLRAYKCTKAPNGVDTNRIWHLGHLHETVIQGSVSREERYEGSSSAKPREVRYSIPQVMVDIMKDKVNTPPPEPTDDDKGAAMATVGELARVSLAGFDKKNSQYKDVNLQSPPADKVAMVHSALKAYAIAHGFEEGEYAGKKGLVGRVSLKALAGELFGVPPEDDKIKALTSQIYEAARRQRAFVCLDSEGRFENIIPIWWVSSTFGSDVKAEKKPAPAPKSKKAKQSAEDAVESSVEAETPSDQSTATVKTSKRVKKPPERVIDRTFAVKSILTRVAAKYDTALTRFEINDELKAQGLDELTSGEFKSVMEWMLETKTIVARKMSEDDVKTIKATGGLAPTGRRGYLIMLKKYAPPSGEIPPLLGSLAQLRATLDEGSTAPTEAEAKVESEAVEEPANVSEAKQVATEPVMEVQVPNPPSTMTMVSSSPGSATSTGGAVARTLVTFNEDQYKHFLDQARVRIEELEAENEKLRIARDGLLAVIDTLK